MVDRYEELNPNPEVVQESSVQGIYQSRENESEMARVAGLNPNPEVVQESSVQREYRLRASELLIKPVDGGEWLTIDGVEYTQWGDEKLEFPSAQDETIVESRLAQVGKYDSNNGTLAFVDENGIMKIGHSTDGNLLALKEAGYQRGNIWVPFSNGECPVDQEIKKKYLELRERGREINRQRNIEQHLQIFSKEAERKGVVPVEGGLFMMVDGIEYTHFWNQSGQIGVNTDGNNFAIDRVQQVGTFGSNNGRIAFVDEKGQMWVGASTPENWEALRNANYHRGGIWVPFSNGEIPKDRATYEQLRDTLTGKTAEQLSAERSARVEEIIANRIKLFREVTVIPDRTSLYSMVADKSERYFINIEALVQETLQPRLEQDNGGFQRKVYTLNGRTFAFKGREELPVYDTVYTSRSILLGENPNWVEDQEFQRYISDLEATQTQYGAPEHYIVNKSILGVVDLAIRMGSTDTTLPQIREEIARGEYSERSLNLIDALLASNYINYTGFGNQSNTDAEAVVLLSLLGDSRAQSAVAEAVETMQLVDREKIFTDSKLESEEKPLQPQDLCVVHATQYLPKSDENGYLVTTTFDATKGKVLRNSVHTALNHKVAGHMYGSWEDAGYVLIAPFQSMMRANGTPAVLNTVDTYWTANPGQPVKFEDATLVAPGGSEVRGLFEIRNDNLVVFKSGGLGTQDLIELADYIGNTGSLDNFSRDIDSALNGALHPYGSAMELGERWDFDTTAKAINQYLYHDDNSWGHQPALLNILTAVSSDGETLQRLEDKIRQIIIDSNAISGLKPDVQDQDEAIQQLANTLADRIRSTMFTEINELAVRETIKRKGFTVQSGGMWAWGDSFAVTERTRLLGQQLSVPVESHTNTPDHALTERFIRGVRQASQTETGENQSFDWKKFNVNFDDLVPQVNQQTRRVLYASGLITARN